MMDLAELKRRALRIKSGEQNVPAPGPDPYGWIAAEKAEMGFEEFNSSPAPEPAFKPEPVKVDRPANSRELFLSKIERMKQCRSRSPSAASRVSAAIVEQRISQQLVTQSAAAARNAAQPRKQSAAPNVAPGAETRVLRHKARCGNCGRKDCRKQWPGRGDGPCQHWYPDADHRHIKWTDYE